MYYYYCYYEDDYYDQYACRRQALTVEAGVALTNEREGQGRSHGPLSRLETYHLGHHRGRQVVHCQLRSLAGAGQLNK